MKGRKNPLDIPSKPFYQIVLPDGNRLEDMHGYNSPRPVCKGAVGGKRWKQPGYLKSRIEYWLDRGGVSHLVEARIVKYVPTYEVEDSMSIADFVGELFSKALTEEQIKRRKEEEKRKKRLDEKRKKDQLDKQKRKALYEELKREFDPDQG